MEIRVSQNFPNNQYKKSNGQNTSILRSSGVCDTFYKTANTNEKNISFSGLFSKILGKKTELPDSKFKAGDIPREFASE